MTLKKKLLYFISLLVILPLIIFIYTSDYYTKNIMLRDKIDTINIVLDEDIKNVSTSIDGFVSISRLTSHYPPIQGIIRSRLNGGIDPVDGSSLQDWKERLQSIFTSQLQEFGPLYQMRYLDESGKELVRVQRYNNRIEVVPDEKLQDKSDRYYFQETKKLKDDVSYISPVDLNVEEGKIERPFRPTIRFCVKVTSADKDEFKGIIALNFEAQQLFDLLDTPVIGETFILDQDGYFINHPDPSKLYGFQLNSGENYFKENPKFRKNVTEEDSNIFYNEKEKEYRIWKKVYYQRGVADRYWVVVHRFKDDVFLKIFYSWRQVFYVIILVAIILVSIVAWIFSGFIINPILALSGFVSRVERKQSGFNMAPGLKDRDDEIGLLASSVEKMGRAMLEDNIKLDHSVKEKTKELQRRMEEAQESRKQAEESERKAREALNVKSEFTSMVSHELRTPLTVIKESVAIVYDGSLGDMNDRQKSFLETAKRNVDRLGRLINDVLDYQKLEARQMEFDMKPEDINDVVREAGEGFVLPLKKKGVELVFKLAPDLPKLNVDKDKIIQVLINLIGNAGKFTDKGSVVLMTERLGDNTVQVSVKDSGIGIKEEDQTKLFKSFSQVSTGSARKTGGTGLGLALSKKIVEHHRGKIGAESVFGQGSMFYFILPIVERRSQEG